jgi:hypothetical protein
MSEDDDDPTGQNTEDGEIFEVDGESQDNSHSKDIPGADRQIKPDLKNGIDDDIRSTDLKHHDGSQFDLSNMMEDFIKTAKNRDENILNSQLGFFNSMAQLISDQKQLWEQQIRSIKETNRSEFASLKNDIESKLQELTQEDEHGQLDEQTQDPLKENLTNISDQITDLEKKRQQILANYENQNQEPTLQKNNDFNIDLGDGEIVPETSINHLTTDNDPVLGFQSEFLEKKLSELNKFGEELSRSRQEFEDRQNKFIKNKTTIENRLEKREVTIKNREKKIRQVESSFTNLEKEYQDRQEELNARMASEWQLLQEEKSKLAKHKRELLDNFENKRKILNEHENDLEIEKRNIENASDAKKREYQDRFTDLEAELESMEQKRIAIETENIATEREMAQKRKELENVENKLLLLKKEIDTKKAMIDKEKFTLESEKSNLATELKEDLLAELRETMGPKLRTKLELEVRESLRKELEPMMSKQFQTKIKKEEQRLERKEKRLKKKEEQLRTREKELKAQTIGRGKSNNENKKGMNSKGQQVLVSEQSNTKGPTIETDNNTDGEENVKVTRIVLNKRLSKIPEDQMRDTSEAVKDNSIDKSKTGDDKSGLVSGSPSKGSKATRKRSTRRRTKESTKQNSKNKTK